MRRTRWLSVLVAGLALGVAAPAALADDDPDQGHPERPLGWEAKRLAKKPAGTEDKHSYFYRVHPWMRGAFEVVP